MQFLNEQVTCRFRPVKKTASKLTIGITEEDAKNR